MTRKTLLPSMSFSLTRRDVLAAATAASFAPSTALAQNGTIPSSSRELWQWVRNQPVLEPRLAYLDVASGGPTVRAAMAAEYRAREAQSYRLATMSTPGYWA